MVIPIGVDYRARRWPVVTFTLMGINVVVHIISMFIFWGGSEESFTWWMDTFWLTPANSGWHTYLTSIFMHGDIFHLLGNMVYLFLFGACLEDMMGRWQFTVFYLFGGLVADFGHILLTADHFSSEMPLVGASGAISACMAGFAMLLHKTKVEFKWFFILWLWVYVRVWSGGFFLPAWVMMSLWFGQDVLGAILDMVQEEKGGGTAFGAHIGGAAIGLAVIAVMKKKMLQHREDEERADEEEAAASEYVCPVPTDAQLYLYDNGVHSGPFNLGEVSHQIRQGFLSASAIYWYHGQPEWRNVKEIG